MTSRLVARITKKYRENNSIGNRNRVGSIAGIIGMICNLLMFVFKFVFGSFANSISIISDAFNNLSDFGSNLVSVFGFKLSGRPSDKKHPFGYGRIEYLSGLAVAIMIIMVGFEFVKNSIMKIINPDKINFSIAALVVLTISILVKFWLSLFYKRLGKGIDSTVLAAFSVDSKNDVIITFAALLSLIVSRFTAFNADGWVGLMISGYILYSGWGIIKDTLSPLLGQAPDEELVNEIKRRILNCEGISGVHDLIVHNYGPQKYIASAHAEVPSCCDIMKMHDIIDLVEREINSQLNVPITLHLDPIDTDDERTIHLKERINEHIKRIDENLDMHDFRMVKFETHTNLIFDVVVPQECTSSNDELKKRIKALFEQEKDKYFLIITFDRNIF